MSGAELENSRGRVGVKSGCSSADNLPGAPGTSTLMTTTSAGAWTTC